MQSTFTEGNVIFLHSVSSGKNIRITGQGVVEGVGGAGVWGEPIKEWVWLNLE